jgi:hypothetical protein
MPIYRRFISAPFDPEHITLMDVVFGEVCGELGLARRDDALCDIIADAILACARRGIRDPVEMRRCARDVLQAA